MSTPGGGSEIMPDYYRKEKKKKKKQKKHTGVASEKRSFSDRVKVKSRTLRRKVTRDKKEKKSRKPTWKERKGEYLDTGIARHLKGT